LRFALTIPVTINTMLPLPCSKW